MSIIRRLSPRAWMIVVGAFLALIALGLGIGRAAAGNAGDVPAQLSPLHPAFALLDAEGVNVLESGAPVSTMQTCGSCHDTAFIADHSFHADLGLRSMTAPGQTARRCTSGCGRTVGPPPVRT